MSKICVVDSLVKKYGDHLAVNHVSFDVEEGALFAFLGPNGAGKSTTINAICTLLKVDDGMISIDGFEVGKRDEEIRKRIGIVFQDSVLDRLLTVEENLEIRASLYGICGAKLQSSISDVAEQVGITDILHRRYGQLSGGQKRRADIARALIHSPKMLFLDEPTTGLDPQIRLHIWKTIRKLQREKKMTVFLTTHYMEEAAEADDVAIIDQGKIVARGTPSELRVKYSTDLIKINPKIDMNFRNFLENEHLNYKEYAGLFTIPVKNSQEALNFLKRAEPFLDHFEVVHGTMDDVFINLTGQHLREKGSQL